MKTLIIIFLLLTINSLCLIAQEDLLINTYNRTSYSLNGEWNYIIDPYETGFYNYRYEPYDNFQNPGNGAYFLNSKPKDKTDLIEFDFDKSETILVPGDWNTQKEKLFYYDDTFHQNRTGLKMSSLTNKLNQADFKLNSI